MPSCFKFLLTFLCIPSVIFSQTSSSKAIDVLAGSVIKNIRSNSNEIVLLQTDKTIYATGETIWIKAFLLDSVNNRFSTKHKIIFVDMVNDKDSMTQQLILPVAALQTDAAFHLKEDLAAGNYFIRAYTDDMAAGNKDNIGLKAVYIFNTEDARSATAQKAATVPKRSTIAAVLADIYPEGGALISGTDNIVAFRLHDQNNMPIQAEIMIRDLKNNKAVNFTTNANGLGKCTLTPSWYSKYGVYIKNNDHYDSITILPLVNPYAVQLAVTEQNQNSIKLRVMMEDSIFRTDYPTYLLAIQDDSLYFASVGQGMYELNILASQLPAGVVHLLLFNEKKELASERSIYMPRAGYTINVSTDKDHYGAREKVQLNIALQDASGKPLVAALAVTVKDARFADTMSLNSFKPNALGQLPSADAALEMLVMPPVANKWMHEFTAAGPGPKNSAVDYFSLKGKVLTKKNDPVPGEKVIIMSKENSLFLVQDTTDAQGIFETHLPDFADSTEFNIQLTGKKDIQDNYQVVYEPAKYPSFATPPGKKETALQLNQQLVNNIRALHLESLLTDYGKMTLPPVTVSTTENKNGKVKNNKSFNPSILTKQMLTEGGYNEIGGAVLRSGKFHLFGGYLINGGPNGFNSSPNDEPIVVVDGVQVTVPNTGDPSESSPVLGFLRTISTAQVEYVKILTNTDAGIYGVRGGHGVIEIHTTSKIDVPQGNGSMTNAFPKGYHIPPVFPVPDYTNKTLLSSKTPDLRTTIYWNANVATGPDGKASVDFFTADAPATYLVTITGVSTNGKRIYKEYFIKRN